MKTKVSKSAPATEPKRSAFLPASSRSLGLATFGVLALPVLVAIWALSWFVTQDGPLYLYNSHIMLESLKSGSAFGGTYFVQWVPLPYWGAYALLMGLMPILSARVADQVLMTLTSVGLAGAILWLRWRVAGWENMAVIAPVAVLLSMSVLWFFGLYSFLLGAVAYFFVVGYWWTVRDNLGLKQAALLAFLLVASYFCHLVSMGLTVIAIGVLAIATPGPQIRRRLLWTALSMAPLLPLIVVYRRLMSSGGEMKIQWMNLSDALSPLAWFEYIKKADFIKINHPEMAIPPGGLRQTLWQLPVPSVWAVAGLLLLLAAAIMLARKSDDKSFYNVRRGWIVLSAVLLAGGLFGPDDLGGAHGGLLRERLLLIGLASLLPALKLDLKHTAARLGFLLLVIASLIQSGLVWDYAHGSDVLVGELMKAKPYVGTGNRVAAMMVNPGWQYRASPIVHAPNMLGISTANFIWNNYGPSLYYFPVRHLNKDFSPRSEFIGSDLQYYDFFNSQTSGEAIRDWTAAMESTHGQIDILVVWGSTPDIDRINERWFESQPIYSNEIVKVFKHR